MPNEGAASKYIKRYGFLKDQYKKGFEAQQKDVSDYILTNRGFFPDSGQQPNQGDPSNTEIIDPEATRAVLIYAAGMQGGLTSPARPWARFKMQDPDLGKFGPVREWLNMVEKIFYSTYSQSNFYQAIYTDYIELVGFCTSCLVQEESFKTIINFRNQTAGTYFIQENQYGTVDTVYRLVPMIAKNIIQKFGEKNVRQAIKTSAEKNPYQFFDVVHAVQPNNEREPILINSQNKAFESVYFEPSVSQKLLMKSGFEDMPFHVARYSISGGDVYGRGPGFDEMGNVKQLQEMQETSYIALHKEIDPPMAGPSAMIDDMDTLPGGVTPWDGGQKPEKLYDVKLNISETEKKIERLQEKIKEGFFNDVFLMISNTPGIQPDTATAVMEKKEEKLMMLGPIIDRTIFEKLDPCIERSLGILWRGGYLPPPPEEMQDQEMDIEYISLLAQAQKLIGSSSLKALSGYVGELALIDESAVDKLNVDAAIDEYGDMVGVAPGVINDADTVDAIRQQRADQQQAMLEQQQMQEMVGGAKSLSETDTEGKNMLTDIAGAVQ